MSLYSIIYDRELVLEFVLVFSRFEYSLKRKGFLTKNATHAESDWDSFAVSCRGRFTELSSPEFKDACRTLLSRPPKKQIVAPEGTLGWAETKRGPSEREEEFLVRLVRTIRNNLFHGGKFPYPDGPVQDVARDRELINSALVVLKEALALHPDLDATFREAA